MSLSAIVGTPAAPPPNVRPAAAVEEPPAAGRKAVDITRVKFKVMFEVKQSDVGRLNRALKNTGFSASDAGEDCSHLAEGYGYSRVEGPTLTLAGGGFDKLDAALQAVHGVTKVPGKSAAMRIMVDQSVLDDEGVTNLINMHLANEALIFRLAMAGGPGRTPDHKAQWSPPLSTSSYYTHGGKGGYDGYDYWDRKPAMRKISGLKSVESWRKQLKNRHWCMNSSEKGWWVFRYFDTSFNLSAVHNSIQLLLGMVKAAAEGRGRWDQVRPLPDTKDKEVAARQWRDFVGVVAPQLDAPLQESFRAAGGKLQCTGLSSEAKKAAGELIAASYRFEAPDEPGAALTFESLNQRMIDEQMVRVCMPDADRGVVLKPESFERFVLAERGVTAKFPPALQERLLAAAPLGAQGIQFTDADGTPISVAMAALLAKNAGCVVAHRGDESLPIDPRDKAHPAATSMQILHTLTLDPSKIPNDIRTVLKHVDWLAQRGYQVVDGAGQAMQWPTRVAHAFLNGGLYLKRGGQAFKIDDLPSLEKDFVAMEMRKDLDPRQRALLDDAEELMDRGFALVAANDRVGGREKVLTKRSIALLEAVIADPPCFKLRPPASDLTFDIQNETLLHQVACAATGDDKGLDDATRIRLQHVDALLAHGYKFVSKATGRPLPEERALAVLMAGQWFMQAGGSREKLSVNDVALRNLSCHEDKNPDAMDAPVRAALDKVQAMRARGFTVDVSDASLICALSRGDSLYWKDPVGMTHGADAAEFARRADEQLAAVQVPPQHQAELEAVGRMMSGGRIRVTRINQDVVSTSTQLAWLFGNGIGLQVNGAHELNQLSHGAPAWAVPLDNWDALATLVANESDAPSDTVARLVSDLRKTGCQFYYVAAPNEHAKPSHTPITLNSAVRLQLDHAGVKVHLPHWRFWHGWIRKNVTIKPSAKDPQRAQRDLEALRRAFPHK